MMRMDRLDKATADAVQAALLSAYNTARYPIDMETAAYVLACFLHADPLRKHKTSDGRFHEPFGAPTAYGLLQVLRPSDISAA
jgi:hypothetical protein